MRTFYLFHVNEFYSSTYQKNPYKLYKIFDILFHEREYDRYRSYKLYKQIVIPFNKMLCNNYIIKKNRLNYEYFYDNQSHFIKKNEEHAKMVIGSIHIKIESDNNFPTFFKDINNFEEDIFVCDFENGDYFWLDKVVKKYGQKTISIVE